MLRYIPRRLRAYRLVLNGATLMICSGIRYKSRTLLNARTVISAKKRSGFWSEKYGLCDLYFGAAGGSFRVPLLRQADADQILEWLEETDET